MKIKGVLVFPTQIEDVLMKIEGVSENYQLEKYTKGPFTNLRIKVEPSVERMKAGNLDSLAKQIEEEIYATLYTNSDFSAFYVTKDVPFYCASNIAECIARVFVEEARESSERILEIREDLLRKAAEIIAEFK